MSYQALAQPAGIGRVLDSGFKLFFASLKPVLLLVVFMAIINIIMQYAMFQIMLPAQEMTSPEEMQQYMLSMMPQFVGVSVVMWVVTIILYNALLSSLSNVHSGGDGVMYDALVTGIRKALPVLIGAILYSIAITLGFVLLIIPGLILMISLMFFQVLIVVDDAGVFSSLKQSHRLVWGNYWRTTAVILVPFFIIYALLMVVVFAAAFVGAASGAEIATGQMHATFDVFDMLGSVVSVLMVTLLGAIFIAHVNDLKLRKSGSDLEQRMGD